MTPELEARLDMAHNLPSLPAVALRVVELGQDPDAEPAEVAEALFRDPALAAKILRAANSPLYAQRRRVDNLRQAIMALGLDATLTLALSFTLVRSLRGAQGRGLDYRLFWRRALMTGAAARAIGEREGRLNTEELLLAGLLQDIGMLALDAVMPKEYGAIAGKVRCHETLRLSERKTLETDHGEVGSWLMQRWRLPRYLAMAAAGSHDPEGSATNESEHRFLKNMAVASVVADIWVAADPDSVTLEAAALAHECFGWEQGHFSEFLDSVSEEAPPLARMFELDLSGRDLAGISGRAREVLTLRSLHMIHEAAAAQKMARELEVQNRQLREDAERDPLTELHNRRHLSRRLQGEFDSSTAQAWPLTLALVDLDHFKSINERFGHQGGDAVLYAVAGVLRRCVRQSDVLARYGGEEFLVALPGIGRDGAFRVLDRLRREVADSELSLDGGEVPRVTLSGGYATHMDCSRFEDLEALIRAADEALRAAKKAGRDQVLSWHKLEEEAGR